MHECPLDGKCIAENIVYKCVALVDGYLNKAYLGTAEGDFKQRFYNHRMSFNNEGHSTDTTLSKITPSLKWSITNLYQPIQIFPKNISCVCEKNLKFCSRKNLF